MEAQASNRKYLTIRELEDIIALKQDGLSNAKVAQIMGMSEPKVAYWAKKHGFKTSGKSGRPPDKYRVFLKETGELLFTGTSRECGAFLGISSVSVYRQAHEENFRKKAKHLVELVVDD